jgi:hypothetical protein
MTFFQTETRGSLDGLGEMTSSTDSAIRMVARSASLT